MKLFFVHFLLSFQVLASLQIDCGTKGCWLDNNSDSLIIYFRGHTKEFNSSPGYIPANFWQASAKSVLTKEPYNLLKHDLESSLYITGSSHLALSNGDIEFLLDKLMAKNIILASHSGGYLGLRNTVKNLSSENKGKVNSILMLDNFYSPSLTKKILQDSFSYKFLIKNCYGFTTPHNLKRYNSYFNKICPQVTRLSKLDHVNGLACLKDFEQQLMCKI